jgi:hypothetical protein
MTSNKQIFALGLLVVNWWGTKYNITQVFQEGVA